MISPFVLFPAFVVINFLNFIDRAIIPATSNEFLLFISSTTTTSRPNIYLGILQSSFIVGFAISSIIFTSLIRTKGAFYVIAVGLIGWVIAAIGAGISLRFHCFGGVFLARMLSGVGEASFVGSAAPWIATNAPIRSKGMWLAMFYTAIPVGTAFGYSYASYVADHIGVEWAFIFQAMAMLPIIVIFSYATLQQSTTFVHGQESIMMESSQLEESFFTATEGQSPLHPQSHPHFSVDNDRNTSCHHSEELGLPTLSPSSHHLSNDGLIMSGLRQRRNESDVGGYVQLSMQPGEDSFDMSINVTNPINESLDSTKSSSSSSRLLSRHRSPIKTPISSSSSTLLDDIVFIIHQPIYVCITLGCAAQVAVMAGLGCFGPSFLMGLEYFTSETSASSSFGMVVLLAGVVGTPLGGLLADYCQSCQENVQHFHENDHDDNEEDSVEQNELGDVVVIMDLESSPPSSSPAPLPSSTDRFGHKFDVGIGNVTTSTDKDHVYTNVNKSHSNSNNFNNSIIHEINESITGLTNDCADHTLIDPLISEQQLFEQQLFEHDHAVKQHVSFSHMEPISSSTTTLTNFRQLKIMMMIVAASTFSATVCLCSTYWVTSREVFMLSVTGGCMLVFLCNPAINLGLMLSVPEHYRPLALALTSVCVHIFGDVPSPVITGILKDFIAPACTISDVIDINEHSLSTSTTIAGKAGTSMIGTIITNIGGIASNVHSRIISQQPILSGTSLPVDNAVGIGLDTLFTGSVRVTTNGITPLTHPLAPPVPPVAPVVVSISTVSQTQPMIHLPTPCQTYEKWGIHTTLFLVSTWLVVASFFYMAAWYFAYQASQQQQNDHDILSNTIQHANQQLSKKNKERVSSTLNDLSANNSLHGSHNHLHNHNSNNRSSAHLKSNPKGVRSTSILGFVTARLGLATNTSTNVMNNNNSINNNINSSNLKQPLLDGDCSRGSSVSSTIERSATEPLKIVWT